METVVEVKKRGLVTIPEAVRKVLEIEEGSILSIEIKKVINVKKESKD
ncbi:MAG: AbrB/MazE/SpoVT family DNA-binding domain-containing protein [Candidatus Omnitrophica bacterium]|nr:AbrB/MazE/SpoVT family DNA-binding domain-containing protein [Candidatus Omnitrophota bacterium]